MDFSPCPFCGAPGVPWKLGGSYYVRCRDYGKDGHLIEVKGVTFYDAMEKWNRRTIYVSSNKD